MLNELVADIQDDFTDEEGDARVASEYVNRAAERALPLRAADLDVLYQLKCTAYLGVGAFNHQNHSAFAPPNTAGADMHCFYAG